MYQMYLVKYAGVDPANGKALYWGWDYDANGERIEDSYHVKSNYDTKDRQGTGNIFRKSMAASAPHSTLTALT